MLMKQKKTMRAVKFCKVNWEYVFVCLCVQEKGRPANNKKPTAAKEKMVRNSNVNSLSWSSLHLSFKKYRSCSHSLDCWTLSSFKVQKESFQIIFKFLHLHAKVFFSPLCRGFRMSLEMEHCVGALLVSHMSQRWSLVSRRGISSISRTDSVLVSCLFFFFRFLNMTSPAARKRHPPPHPSRRNANSASPKSASDLMHPNGNTAPLRCFHLCFFFFFLNNLSQQVM